MLLLPSGTFQMGSPEDEVGRTSAETLHEVTLTRDFFIGITEVTQRQFDAVAGYQPSPHRCSDCPVVNVSWHEAAAFTNQLSRSDGLSECYACEGSGSGVACDAVDDPYDCEGYRLPTEAEWEYAARSAGEVEAAFPNGGDLEGGQGQDCLGDLVLDDGTVLDGSAWYCGNSDGVVQLVALLDPNEAGLYDLSGGVWEWVGDWFDAYPEGPVEDPWGPGDGDRRVTRGGAVGEYPEECRAAHRDPDYPHERYTVEGFRIARTSG